MLRFECRGMHSRGKFSERVGELVGKQPGAPAVHGVFLDRDGVINQYRSDYVRAEGDFDYYSFTPDAFKVLGLIGLPVVVVTNQSGIGRGYTTEAIVDAIHDRLRTDAAAWGAKITSVEICPHTPQEGCKCRKPGPAMFERAAKAHGIQLAGSYMVGDAPSDVQAGRNLSMTTIRVETGRGGEAVPSYAAPDWTVPNLFEAAGKIAQLEGLVE